MTPQTPTPGPLGPEDRDSGKSDPEDTDTDRSDPEDRDTGGSDPEDRDRGRSDSEDTERSDPEDTNWNPLDFSKPPPGMYAQLEAERKEAADRRSRKLAPREGHRPARTTPIAVRFDEFTLQRLKAIASRRNKGYQTLLKEFVIERLYEEERREGIIQS